MIRSHDMDKVGINNDWYQNWHFLEVVICSILSRRRRRRLFETKPTIRVYVFEITTDVKPP